MAEDVANSTSAQIDETKTGLPGLTSWKAVYLLVTSVFILYAVLLTVLSRMYS